MTSFNSHDFDRSYNIKVAIPKKNTRISKYEFCLNPLKLTDDNLSINIIYVYQHYQH